MEEEKRKTGIDIISEVPWGTHLCQFYKTREDLTDILVPYFKAGLENNEFCMWVTSGLLDGEKAKKALRKAVPDFERYLKRGQIEIVPHTEWYLKDDSFSLQQVLNAWIYKLNQALSRGYDGMRVTGDTAWLKKNDWGNFINYEKEVNKAVGNCRMLAICTYSPDKYNAYEIINAVSNHRFAFIKQKGKWVIIESSERKRAEEKIRKEKEFILGLLLKLKEGFAVVDREGRQILVNDELREMTGYTKEELLNQKPPFKYWAEEGIEDINKAFKKTLNGIEGEYELVFKRKNGERFVALVCPRKIIDSYGDTIFFATIKDITKRKKAEEMLERDKNYFEKLHNSIGNAIFMVKIPERAIGFVSNPVEDIFGYKVEECIGKNTEMFYPDKEGYFEFGRKLERAIEQEKDIISNEQLLRRKNGEIFPAEIKTSFLKVNGEITQAISVVNDITERKKAHEEIKNMAKFPSESPYPVLRISKDGTLLYANDASKTLLSEWRCEIGHHAPEQWRQLVAGVLDSDSRKHIEVKHRNTVFLFTAVPVSGDYINLYAQDITEMKQSQDKLSESEEKFRDLYDHAPDMYHSIDKKGIITECNKAWETNLGYTKEEIIGRPITDFFTKKSKGLFKNIFPKITEEKALLNVEREFVRKDGTVFPVILNIFVEVDKNGKLIGTRAIARDITERKKAEQELQDAYQKLKETQQQLIQTGKMAAMGQLAAGISHELNQPLTGIKGFAQAGLMDLDKSSPLRKDLSRVVEQADRMDKIIQHVRFFARRSDFYKKEIDINQPIEDALMLLNEQLRVHNIRVEKFLSKDLPKIQGDPNQLEQAFLNLITNARDAIDSLKSPEGGEITIKSVLSKGKKNIEIIFRDTGCGISKEDMGNIFNPFYTTKSPDGGMGLGLSIVYRIIEDHKGVIEAESQVGKGTMFRIMLPTS